MRRRIALRIFKHSSTESATQEVFIPDSLWYKLGKLVSWKRTSGESLVPEDGASAAARGSRRAASSRSTSTSNGMSTDASSRRSTRTWGAASA